MRNNDIFLIRHLAFFWGETKLALKHKNYFGYKNVFLKILSRINIRLFSNYLQSFMYYLTFKTKNLKSNKETPNLITHGYELLKDIDTSCIDFLDYKIDELYKDNDIVVTRNKIDYLKAEKFARENGFHSIACKYFNVKNCNLFIDSWNTKPFSDRKRLGTTQWHRDRDGFKVLKFFIYLNDVDDDTGPHAFAPFSHRIRPIRFVPQIRYSDDNVEKFFSKIILITGKKGKCFVEDTTGLHKATPPNKKHRMLLQFSYFTGPIYWDRTTQKVNLN